MGQQQEEQFILAPASVPQEQFLNSDCTVTLYAGARGAGKALRHGEKVLLEGGFKNIEHVSIGDVVVTPKNTKEVVTGVYPQGEVDIYRVTFRDGSTVDTCGEHLWKWRKSGSRNHKVTSTLDILKWMKSPHQGRDKRVPFIELTEPVEYGLLPDLPIHPYVLGFILGDGSITTNSISITTNDPEIPDIIEGHGYSIYARSNSGNRAGVYGIHGLVPALRDLGLLGCNSLTKFIPDIYLNASIEDRFYMVQGLMDSDGYVDKTGRTEFSTISPELKDGMIHLLHSLGFTATCSEKDTHYRDTFGDKINCSRAYSLYIRGRNQPKLFRLARKKERAKFKNVSNSIKDITHIGKDCATCISISGDEKLFLTNNFIPTHNSFATIINMVKFAAKKNSTIIYFRRVKTEIKMPGGIWQESVPIFRKMFPDVQVRSRDCELYIPSTNSVVKFEGLQYTDDIQKILGSQFSAIFLDEAVTFEPFNEFVLPLFGSMRNAAVDYTPQMFWATNPRFNNGIYHWIKDFYLDDYGIPLSERSNVKRWFVLQNSEPLWFNSEKEALDYCASIPAIGGVTVRPLTFTSIKAHVTDNIPLMESNPDYVANLQALPDIKRRIYLEGSWTAREEEAGLYNRNMSKVVPFANMKANKRVRAFDMASQPVSSQSPNPDFTRGVLVSKDNEGVYTVEDIVSVRDRPHVVDKLIFDTARQDREMYGHVVYILPVDPGQAGVARANELKRKLAEMGVECRLAKTNKSKRTRFLPFSAIAEAGYVNVVRADWNETFFTELEEFTGLQRHERDDIVDCCSDAILFLNKDIQLPDFTIPQMQLSSNQFGIQSTNYSSGLTVDISQGNFNF